MILSETAISAGAKRAAAGYTVSIGPCFERELDVWSRMAERGGAALAFQSRDWLVPWSTTIGRREALDVLAVTIRDADGTPVVGLPLVRERSGIRRIGFADGGVADYNAPILGRDAPQDAVGATKLWRALLRALPAADVVRFERMPASVGARANPFALLSMTRPASVGGLELRIEGTYADWRQTLPRRYRMELGRCARLFEALPMAKFERLSGAQTRAFEALEILQRERIGALQLSYALDEPYARDFYRRLASDLDDGPGVLTTLATGDHVVAALFGLRHGSRYIMLRIGADAAYARMSPARHLITRTIETMRSEGVDCFDFGRGDYVYKRKLGAEPLALYDLIAARSVYGAAEATSFNAKAFLRRHPRAHATAKRLVERLRR